MMKRVSFILIVSLFALSILNVHPALAQTETPPTEPMGKVMGTVVNQNTGGIVTGVMDVMLHMLDQNFEGAGMLHGQSQADGTFLFSDVPFTAGSWYAVMASYDGVTYFSETIPVDLTTMEVNIDVPVYESTSDLANIQVDQMHVIFDIAEDGLEIREIYSFSNMGERTVKNAYELGTDPQSGTTQFATLEFPLPDDADFIFFKPDDQDRFIKLDGGFADTYPILPGTQSSQLMVTYLVPYTDQKEYTYTAPLNITRINFLVPDQTDISLNGTGLTEPQPMNLQNGEAYRVYSHSELLAGQTVSVLVKGKMPEAASSKNNNTLIGIVAAFVGFAVIGAGIWRWRKADDVTEEEDGSEMDDESDESTLEDLIAKIARLDEEHDQGKLNSMEYKERRQVLMQRAKRII